ncbi:isoleucine--tRNA ligase, partial [Patescibacteria group bacterium]|nr:isoleucine--tRNA ligase [Patescibacteria group bacterium]
MQNFPQLEKQILKFWKSQKIFEKSIKARQPKAGQPLVEKNAKPFVFYEGPPTANGKPGIHHVLARAFKDLFPRYKTMQGFFCERRAGWDTHGLPVELEVEKKLKISGKPEIESLKKTKYESIKYFNKLCKDSVWEYKKNWEDLTQRMGFWIDLENPYITYKNEYIKNNWQILKKIWDAGLLVQDYRIAHYCYRCGTGLSSHEVAQGYKRVTDESVYVKFKLKAQNSKLKTTSQNSNIYLLAWTTTPWTLPGNVALAIGENIDYVLVKNKSKDEYYILAKDRKNILDTKYKILNTFKGKDLIGLEYKPLFDLMSLRGSEPCERPTCVGRSLDYGRRRPKQSRNMKKHLRTEIASPLAKLGTRNDRDWQNAYKVYPADFVNTEEGTGIVHTAVMYGEDDYQLGQKIGLPRVHTVDENGKFNFLVKGFENMHVKNKKTTEKILNHLKKNNNFFAQENYEHDYPFCWRCDTPLLYYAKKSWFIKMSKLRKQLLKNNQKINWIPSHLQKGRFGEWLREVKDWALSRERYWGTPLPIWQCEKCGFQKMIIQNSKFKIQNLHRPFIDEITFQCKCGETMKRVPEVLDCWFDAGAMPFSSKTQAYPADFISEGIDQTRGWFYTLLAISTALGLGPSYKNVISLGLLLDKHGKKMSKSKGNIVVPEQVIEQYGVDSLRWYFYSVNQPGEPKKFDIKDIAEKQRKIIGTLWNSFIFLRDYAGKGEMISPRKTKNILDKWILSRLNQLILKIEKYLDQYDVFRTARNIEEFIDDLSNWYIRRTRKDSNKAVLQDVILKLCQIMAPFTPFIADYIYREIMVLS